MYHFESVFFYPFGEYLVVKLLELPKITRIT